MKKYIRQVEAVQFEGELTPELVEWFKADGVTAELDEGDLYLSAKGDEYFTYILKGDWVEFAPLPKDQEIHERWQVLPNEDFIKTYSPETPTIEDEIRRNVTIEDEIRRKLFQPKPGPQFVRLGLSEIEYKLTPESHHLSKLLNVWDETVNNHSINLDTLPSYPSLSKALVEFQRAYPGFTYAWWRFLRQ